MMGIWVFNANGRPGSAGPPVAALPVLLATTQATRNKIASMFSFKKPASVEDSDDGSDDDEM